MSLIEIKNLCEVKNQMNAMRVIVQVNYMILMKLAQITGLESVKRKSKIITYATFKRS